MKRTIPKLSDKEIAAMRKGINKAVTKGSQASPMTQQRMTMVEVRRMFLAEVEAFFDEEYGPTMLHSVIDVQDADESFAQFVGLKREREMIAKTSDVWEVDKGEGRYKGRDDMTAPCARCKTIREEHVGKKELCPNG